MKIAPWKIGTIFCTFLTTVLQSQHFLSDLTATKGDPLYTTYAAALSRSEFIVDQGYHLVWYSSKQGIDLITDKGGNLCLAWKQGNEVRYRLEQMESEPIVATSYSDLVKFSFYPFPKIRVHIFFVVYSSRIAIQDVQIHNEGLTPVRLSVYPFLHHSTDRLTDVSLLTTRDGFRFQHKERPDSWTVEHEMPHQEDFMNVYLLDSKVQSWGAYSAPGDESGRTGKPHGSFFDDLSRKKLSEAISRDSVKVVSLQKDISIPGGKSAHLRIIRGVAESTSDFTKLLDDCRALVQTDLEQFVKDDEEIYDKIPKLRFSNKERQMMYWCAFSLMRQCMLPPEGKSSYNYYVFSREPTWGWGHGGQVFHESLAMLAYSFMDPIGAMNSQRVFRERQHANGYINYRTGSYLDETILHNNQLTTSAPWYNWENWEIFQLTKDTAFLREMYESGKTFYNFWLENRDTDKDRLCEWGAHAVLESVRDGQVAVWDDVGWPSNFEALDLNAMLVKEAKSLGAMAETLGQSIDAAQWLKEAGRKADLINQFMWDSTTGFYYNIDKSDHDFSYKSTNDLKRQEIIGFLPLWAGIASRQQADILLQSLQTNTKFWRPFGIPTLAADDANYNPKGYWNGPVWVQWQYLVFRGLLDYGYNDAALPLADKVFDNVIYHLKTSHWFWELYSPDGRWAGWNKTYIWTGIVARMLIELEMTR